jgi:N-acetylmuramoyl-L-alanine amidase
MSRAPLIKHCSLHCSAGFSPIENIESFWHRPRSQGGLAWDNKGYNAIVDLQGRPWYLTINNGRPGGYSMEYNPICWEFVTNGIQGFNRICNHIGYIGGVENVGTARNPIWKAKDTRTDNQKAGILESIYNWQKWMLDNGGDLSSCTIPGHRDFSKDSNGNGVIEPWERNKECPSFDAIPEYRWLMVNSKNNANQLPKR